MKKREIHRQKWDRKTEYIFIKTLQNMKNINYLSKFKNLFQTKKALNLFVNEEDIILWVEILKYYYPKTWKKQNRVSWVDISDRVFSEYIRLTNTNSDWFWMCITCWTKLHWTELQCWHYRNRWVYKYRFDVDNCNPQCYVCNVVLNWNYRNYHIYMVKKHWKEKENCIWTDKTLISIKIWQYQEWIKSWYSEIIAIKNKLK